MLELISRLFRNLNDSKIRYCHWKSNVFLEESLLGKEDIDLLIDRKDRDVFESILSSMHFKKVNNAARIEYPSVFHFYGLDEKSGIIVHVHTYYKIITGESILKNYQLPLEEMIFRNTRYMGIVQVPTKAAELVLFVMRMILKHRVIVEAILFYKEYKNIRKELHWLLGEDTELKALAILKDWLPSISPEFFADCLRSLESKSHFLRLVILNRKMRSCLKSYARYSPIKAFIVENTMFLRIFYRRWIKRKRNRSFSLSGAVIAFVGPETSGKSTLVSEIRSWLAQYFPIYSIHAGKPPSSYLTIVPNLFLPILRRIFPRHRTNSYKIEFASKGEEKGMSLLYIIRSLLLAFDRNRLLTKAFRMSRNGAIVLCDRYPSSQIGVMDSPQIDGSSLDASWLRVHFLLARIEEKLYKAIPPPDLVIKLKVPVDIAVQRNVLRIKKDAEKEDYVRRRHAQSTNLIYPYSKTYVVNTNESFTNTLLTVKRLVWQYLCSLNSIETSLQ